MGALPRNRYGEARDVRHSAVRGAARPYLSRVEIRWVAYSAASLATGALALLLGALITPTGNAAESLSLVEMNDGRWLGAAVLFLIASITLTLGLPSIGTLLRGTPRLGTGWRWGSSRSAPSRPRATRCCSSSTGRWSSPTR